MAIPHDLLFLVQQQQQLVNLEGDDEEQLRADVQLDAAELPEGESAEDEGGFRYGKTEARC